MQGKPYLLCGCSVAIVDAENRVLLHRRRDIDAWGLPGGVMEPGESLEEAAIREVREEVGLACHALALFGVYSGPALYCRYANGDEEYHVRVVYLCRDFSGRIEVEESEGRGAAFFSLDDIPAPPNAEAGRHPAIAPIADLRRRWEEIEGGG
jgi:8-oxo-dGTP pyrophosphatase MutT (NUDIX family)